MGPTGSEEKQAGAFSVAHCIVLLYTHQLQVSRAPEHDKVAIFDADGGGEIGIASAASDHLRAQNDEDDKRSHGDEHRQSSWAGAAISAATSFLDATGGGGEATVEKEQGKERVRGQVRHSLVRFEEGARAGVFP